MCFNKWKDNEKWLCNKVCLFKEQIVMEVDQLVRSMSLAEVDRHLNTEEVWSSLKLGTVELTGTGSQEGTPLKTKQIEG